MFWIVTAMLCAVVIVLMARAVLHARAAQGSEAEYDLQIYRDQLTEVERDLARKVISDDEAEQIRTEVSRRILEADRKRLEDTAPKSTGRAMGPLIVVVAAITVGVSYWTYTSLGAPGYGDLPIQARLDMADEIRANRPSQADAEAQAQIDPFLGEGRDPEYLRLVEQLRQAVSERPDDLRGLRLLASTEATLGNFVEAHRAQARLVAVLGEDVQAEDQANLADMLILAAGGYVSPTAESALNDALRLDATNGAARYYTGLLYAQTGRQDLAFRIWERLLAESPQDAVWVPPIRAQIEEMAMRAGVNYELPAAAPTRGPSAADVANAQDMSPEDRQAMIEGMVQGLSDRLATEGGTAQEWGQLIRALGAMGNADRAKAVYAQAQIMFQEDRTSLSAIRQAAVAAGLVQ